MTDELDQLARAGADVPDDWIVIRGGLQPLPMPGTPFSAAAGKDISDAGKGVPHGNIRVTTGKQIRSFGGSAKFKPELSKSGIENLRHVEVIEGQNSAFSDPPQQNPVPKAERIV